jgi:hypothetical protein
MATSKRPVLTAQLPPTPCTPEMRETLVTLAKNNNVSIADIQRQAFSLFLRGCDSKTITEDIQAIKTEEQRT